MKDLEIRGAGNLLGGEQSGHIAGVGFDLYVRMVSEAVAKARGEEPEELAELKLELPIDAHIPHDYISHERLRLEAYTKLSHVATEETLAQVREELVDRYGPVPPQVERLFAVAGLRVRARAAGLVDITGQGMSIGFGRVALAESAQLRLTRLYPCTVLQPAIRTALVPGPTTAPVGGSPLRDEALIDWVTELIDAVLARETSLAAAASVAAGTSS